MKRGMAHVELQDGRVHRIFRSGKAWAVAGVLGRTISVMPRVDAIRQIRRTLWARCNECAWCGEVVDWNACQMHEIVPRGKGGDISMENSIILCYDCHQGREDSAHGNRKLHFGTKSQGHRSTYATI
jgi:hypothetical protein